MLSIIRKIAFPCGIIGGVWTVLVSTLIVLFIPGQGEIVVKEITEGQTEEYVTSVVESTMNVGDPVSYTHLTLPTILLV